jgi:hypothetical protein
LRGYRIELLDVGEVHCNGSYCREAKPSLAVSKDASGTETESHESFPPVPMFAFVIERLKYRLRVAVTFD